MATYVLFFFFNDTHPSVFFFFFFNDTATTEIYTLSLHDALPISLILGAGDIAELAATCLVSEGVRVTLVANRTYEIGRHTSELQSLAYLVCRLLLEKKKINKRLNYPDFLLLLTLRLSYACTLYLY